MTLGADLKSINCTACGAGLDVLGGGRVTTHICPYCGTELDALDNYQALRKFANQTRPASPISIGMKGKLQGVEFTVIGTMAHRERWLRSIWRWVDHQLYSPTHGYAWLTYEGGHFTFSRRLRGSVWLSSQHVETSEHRPSVSARGETYSFFDTGTSEVTFVEGEFTWRPVTNRTVTVTAMSDTAMLSFSETRGEREVYRSVYVDHSEVSAAFSLAPQDAPHHIHPLQPFKAGPNHGFLTYAGLFFAFVCLAFTLFILERPGSFALQERFFLSNLPIERSFLVPAAGKLTQISLQGDGQNSWGYFDIEVTAPDETPVFATGRTVEYYAGYSENTHWTEGSNSTRLRFIPQSTGFYKLWLGEAEAGVWNDPSARNSRRISSVTVTVTNGHSSGLWIGLLGAAFAGLALVMFGRKYQHKRRRWSGSDWTDED